MRRLVLTACLVATSLLQTPAHAQRLDEEKDPAVDSRGPLRNWHKWLGVTTWASLAATTAIGTMRYANVVGFGEPLCAEGNTPIFGRSYGCGDGLRTQHLVSASFTTVSYVATRTLAALMPEPSYERSTRVTIHRALSWVHLAGMIAMPILGFATTATDDRDTRDALATAHLAVGYTTLAAVSTAGALIVF